MTNNSIQMLIICLLAVKGFNYYYVIPMIQILHTVKRFQVLLFNTNN